MRCAVPGRRGERAEDPCQLACTLSQRCNARQILLLQPKELTDQVQEASASQRAHMGQRWTAATSAPRPPAPAGAPRPRQPQAPYAPRRRMRATCALHQLGCLALARPGAHPHGHAALVRRIDARPLRLQHLSHPRSRAAGVARGGDAQRALRGRRRRCRAGRLGLRARARQGGVRRPVARPWLAKSKHSAERTPCLKMARAAVPPPPAVTGRTGCTRLDQLSSAHTQKRRAPLAMPGCGKRVSSRACARPLQVRRGDQQVAAGAGAAGRPLQAGHAHAQRAVGLAPDQAPRAGPARCVRLGAALGRRLRPQVRQLVAVPRLRAATPSDPQTPVLK